MFKKLLIANRGEIALRIIRACRELGIKTVAVHSPVDAESLPVRFADESVCIGPNPSTESYLKISSIISAAAITGAEAIHPGYGFLAENPEFAEVCESCAIKFIGPKSGMIRAMGDKALAKKTMKQAGLPVIPGSEGEIDSLPAAKKLIAGIGYPVMIKAAAGGGGRGMRIAHDEKELETGFRMAQAETKIAFGDNRLYLEKYIERPRHIEVQLLGDQHGTIIHLAERECSIQRRHQKLIEESPSPAINEELRKKLCAIAVKGARAIGYENAGTMEFLLDQQGNFYFMEMNTRIQVEHPVTEMVTNEDIVKTQILIALGERMPIKGDFINLSSHAIECRINAEDPERNFMPTPGKIPVLHLPGGPGVRIDTHVYAGYTIPRYYDSLIAKFITAGRTRTEAVNRMQRALEEAYIEGIKTTIPFHLKILKSEKFRKGELSTSFIEEFLQES
jgi:acetyl-CoA carboxylase biotin carboxylase subunit